ncbi:universal stress protein [Mongoliibacter ruber]|uniref:Nucleotide-binding universal stress UspA family protein n=1 Tax=Mongoliibacter ruber TaxID=1750599 RepID=A0A2T0WTH5_9BACT|nr:universal stress protein [Mongoliibacter ruber]PRY89874.1 nucleotide-binding universal stress UspA family protein [Mongoliibacter ruber]
MKNFTKAMVGLDLSKMDDILVKKTALLSKILGIEKLYFIHVAKDLSLPEEITKNFPDLVAPADESIKADVRGTINENTFPDDVEIEVVVEEGKPMDTVLRWAKIKDVDLIIMGRKESLEGSGSLAKNMAHRAPCPVLFLTEKSSPKIPEKILIPLDFSDYSRMSLEFAQNLAEKTNAKLLGLHVYSVPTGYYKTGKSYEEFAEIMEGHAKDDFRKFLEKHNLTPIDCLFKCKDDGNEGRFIIRVSLEEKADMILMGSRGRTASAAALLGSVAEKLVNINNSVPMLVFKKKGETMTFMEALKKL